MIKAELYFFVEGKREGNYPSSTIFYGLKMNAMLASVPRNGDVIELPDSGVESSVEKIIYKVDGSITVRLDDDRIPLSDIKNQYVDAVKYEAFYLADGLEIFDYDEDYLKFKKEYLNAQEA